MKHNEIDHLRAQLAEIDKLPIAEGANLRRSVQAQLDAAMAQAIDGLGLSVAADKRNGIIEYLAASLELALEYWEPADDAATEGCLSV